MKTIVVFYSLDGNTAYAANEIAQRLGAETFRIYPVKDYPSSASKFFWGGKDVLFGEKPKLKNDDFTPHAYDKIVVGTPLWAGNLTPPVRSFLSMHALGNQCAGFFVCGGGGNTDRCFSSLKKLAGCGEIPLLSLVNPAKNKKEEDLAAIDLFCKQIADL